MNRRLLAVLGATATVCAAASPLAASGSENPALPLGDADLAETRTTRTLAAGVTWTHIVRGDEPAAQPEIGTTTKGPWVVNVLRIDPARAHGQLVATYGPDLARTEPVSALVRHRGGLVGTNASFFTFTASKDYPGDPVGLGIYDGTLQSEPVSADPTEQDVVLDGRSGRMSFGHHIWSGAAVDPRKGVRVPVDALNHPPAPPAGCPAEGPCDLPGNTTWITGEFGATTPTGPGAEAVLSAKGCVVRTSPSARGTALAAGQTSVQATGADAAALVSAARPGVCLSLKQQLSHESGERVPLTPNTFGVNGRYRLTAGGQVVVPPGSGSFFARNPRTVIGRTADRQIVLVTVDGRMTTSVGTTMNETAAVADALGLVDAVNLDGGGSTTLATPSGPLNTPSSGAERPVGDALVWVP